MVSVCCRWMLRFNENAICLKVGFGSGNRFESVPNEWKDGTQTLFGTAAASRQIDDQGVAAESGDAAGEPGHRIVGRALYAHRFGNAGRFAFDDRSCGFRGP